MSDELYEKISFGSVQHFSIGAIPELAHRVITINGVSKAYSMTGWRVGFMTGPAALMKEAAKVQGQSTSNPNSIAQKAALAALLHTAADVEMMRKEFLRRRDMVAGLFSAIPNVNFLMPDGAFYMFVDISKALPTMKVKTSFEFCQEALDKHYLAVVPGEAFGAPGCLRFSFAASDETLHKGVARFAEAMKALS
jgi:aspartate aminotransferase